LTAVSHVGGSLAGNDSASISSSIVSMSRRRVVEPLPSAT
jgi:hypothetical protein